MPAQGRSNIYALKGKPMAKANSKDEKHKKTRAGGKARGPAKRKPASSKWLLLVYKVPSEPSRVRVSVWRELKRLGALYLQQAACILPARHSTASGLSKVRERIRSLGGTSYFFEVPPMDEAQEAELIEGFKDLSGKEYAEIVEECETKFIKEIEFERFRANYTFEEAEEIRQDFEKIQRWYEKVAARDWFGGPGRDEVEAWLGKCESLLEAFEDEVYEKTGGEDRKTRDPRT